MASTMCPISIFRLSPHLAAIKFVAVIFKTARSDSASVQTLSGWITRPSERWIEMESRGVLSTTWQFVTTKNPLAFELVRITPEPVSSSLDRPCSRRSHWI